MKDFYDCCGVRDEKKMSTSLVESVVSESMIFLGCTASMQFSFDWCWIQPSHSCHQALSSGPRALLHAVVFFQLTGVGPRGCVSFIAAMFILSVVLGQKSLIAE